MDITSEVSVAAKEKEGEVKMNIVSNSRCVFRLFRLTKKVITIFQFKP